MAALGFADLMPEAIRQIAYHPAALLEIYIYGDLSRMPSSRHLEWESRRDLELMWLTVRLMPDAKTRLPTSAAKTAFPCLT